VYSYNIERGVPVSIFDQASKKVTETVKGLQKKTNESMAVKRLDSQIKATMAEIEGIYKAIGEAAYAAHADGKSFEGAEELFAGVTALKERIAGYRLEMDKLNDVRRCTECGAQVQRLAKFCPQCGAKLEAEAEEKGATEEEIPEVEICPNCGSERKDKARFCETCGHEFDAASDSEEPEIHEE
jgi:rubredoxin